MALLGIGSIVRGDDGVGPRFIERFRQRYRLPPGVMVEDLGTPGRDLYYALEAADHVIVVDAVRTGEPPGQVRRYEGADLVTRASADRTLAHDPTLVDSILTAQLMGSAPANVVLLGITTASARPGLELSRSVEAAMDELEAAVLAELERVGVRVSRI